MKNKTIKLSQKIYLIDFLKKNNIKIKYFGNKNTYFDSISSIDNMSKNSLTFYEKGYFTILKKVIKKNTIIITNESNIYKNCKNIILSKNPRELFIKILKIIINDNLFETNDLIHKNNDVSKVNIKKNVKIGKNCEIAENVYLANCEIGNNVKIGPNTSIGYEGVTLYKKNKKTVKFPNVGKIIIGNNVNIGANCSLMRGGITNTIISNEVIISNQVNIGHGAVILESTIISAGAQIIGGVLVGRHCMIASGCKLNSNISIGNNCFIGLGSVVTKDVKNNTKV